MITVRDVPYSSDAARASCRTHIMLKIMCRMFRQPRGAQHGPPPAVTENRDRAARAEGEKAAVARRQDRHAATHADPLRVIEQRRQVQRRSSPNHDRHKPEIAAQPAQIRRKPPHSGISPPAIPALGILHPDNAA
jgi:hypothetical protein